ncbi:TELO2-interacting protein 2 isoform X2 [Anarrhichthys ocellatus]|uniref:TELO2-interacting protein 2 isoform X2 n=1 Tax=Anarrhichthys ocellatus TaxID=433405 RepID=UPI0012EE84ED|nr:TELO2-interacting protein 2 isoform X2 [Anarrhichthys ocellatus]
MELSSLLHDFHLSSSSEKPLPCSSLPPITELLSRLQEKLIGASSDSETSSLIGRVERLFQTADPCWLFSANGDEEWAELQAAYGALVGALIGCAALPPCEDDCGSLPASVYQSIPGRAGPDQVWTSSSSRAAAQSLQEVLLRAGGWRDSSHLLMGDKRREEQGGEEGRRSRGLLGGILDVLQPQLTKDSWQRCEAVKLVFSWTLLQVTRPSLSPHLSHLLPPSLLLNDHYRPENCILGVRCLHHIVLNTPAADLRLFNRAEVLYQALFKHLYTSETAVIQPALSCLLDLLVVLEKPPLSLGPSSSRRTSCRHDDVLRLVLTHMEAEQKVALRRVYASALPLYIDRMGVAVCRHLRQVERVVLGYLEVRDPPEETSRLNILEVLKITTREAWPRMACRVDVLLRCLLKLLVAVSSDSGLSVSVRQTLMNQTCLCLKLLDGCCHGDVQRLLQQVDSSCCSSEVLSCLATVTVTNS